jgi:hypothetical protein
MNARTILLALLLALAPAGIASACPNCKASIPTGSSETSSNLPGGFNWSIYLMLGSLVGVGGAVVRMLVREVRQADAATPRPRRR